MEVDRLRPIINSGSNYQCRPSSIYENSWRGKKNISNLAAHLMAQAPYLSLSGSPVPSPPKVCNCVFFYADDDCVSVRSCILTWCCCMHRYPKSEDFVEYVFSSLDKTPACGPKSEHGTTTR